MYNDPTLNPDLYKIKSLSVNTTHHSIDAEDEVFMKKAIALGMQAKGTTGDNPYVGCVIVGEGLVLGEGKTQPPGGRHAEISAFLDAEQKQHSVSGATLYSTVEPCTFFGRTPPCTSAIICKKIKRVVIGIRDPHPIVRGAGIRMLREAGIVVRESVCQSLVEDYLMEWLQSFTEYPPT